VEPARRSPLMWPLHGRRWFLSRPGDGRSLRLLLFLFVLLFVAPFSREELRPVRGASPPTGALRPSVGSSARSIPDSSVSFWSSHLGW